MKPTTGKLADEYAYATECQLATLCGLYMRKSSSKREKSRQRSISEHMLRICRQHHDCITWTRGMRKEFGRVQEILEAADKPESNLTLALDQFLEALP